MVYSFNNHTKRSMFQIHVNEMACAELIQNALLLIIMLFVPATKVFKQILLQKSLVSDQIAFVIIIFNVDWAKNVLEIRVKLYV